MHVYDKLYTLKTKVNCSQEHTDRGKQSKMWNRLVDMVHPFSILCFYPCISSKSVSVTLVFLITLFCCGSEFGIYLRFTLYVFFVEHMHLAFIIIIHVRLLCVCVCVCGHHLKSWEHRSSTLRSLMWRASPSEFSMQTGSRVVTTCVLREKRIWNFL